MSARKHVWVVMSNDYPDRVFGTEKAADDYCSEENVKDRALAETPGNRRSRIYYRWYKMELSR